MNATTIALDLLAVTISAATVCASRYSLKRERNDGPARWLRRGSCTGGTVHRGEAAQHHGVPPGNGVPPREGVPPGEGVLPGLPEGHHCPNADFDLWEQEFERWRKRHA